MIVLLVLVAAVTATGPPPSSCRDPFRQPFAADSPWNMAVGAGAVYVAAGLFTPPKAEPDSFFNDHDYVISTSAADPLTALYNQGEWGGACRAMNLSLRECFCARRNTSRLVTRIAFPRNATFTSFGDNNAFAVVLPDRRTVVQSQPLYRCEAGGPVLALRDYLVDKHTGMPINISLYSGGYATMLGPHGGTGLSAIGGTIRLGELAPNGSINHALKLELNAKDYYFGNDTGACHRWVSVISYHQAVPFLELRSVNTLMVRHAQPALPYDKCPKFGGVNPAIQPGSLLAVPPALSAALKKQLSSVPALKLLVALTDYGGYLVDDTASNRGTFCAEPAVVEEVSVMYGFPLSYVWKPKNKTEPPRCKFSRNWVKPCMRGCCAQPPCGCNMTAADGFWRDMLAVFRALHVVVNSGPTAIGGGGKRRHPPAPPLCPPPLLERDTTHTYVEKRVTFAGAK
jgi:hypothetical protein